MTGHILVTITGTKGSVPRETGTRMRVWANRIQGTIGGGALEWEAMRIARQMLADGSTRVERTLPLGPELGQCCGGAVSLRWDREDMPGPEGAPLVIWGAGHVGRALVAVLEPLPELALTWVDDAAERFPEGVPETVTDVVAATPAALVPRLPTQAHHLIVTYSHDIDLALCHALLGHGFASAGLIGSATKWARFRSRLAALGRPDAEISRIDCPIGDRRLGKHPQAIAIGVATQLLSTLKTPAKDQTTR